MPTAFEAVLARLSSLATREAPMRVELINSDFADRSPADEVQGSISLQDSVLAG